MKLLLYCTKSKPYITRGTNGSIYPSCCISNGLLDWHLNGKIVAECDYEVEAITNDRLARAISDEMFFIERDNLLKDSCLTGEEIKKYFNFYNWKFEKQDKIVGYAIHIKNLHIFDKPKELNKCMSIKTFENEFVTKTLSPEMISKAPQNMMKVKMWVDGKEYGMWKNYILISIRPEHLVNILNGEKKIEIRKKVLKEMLE